MGRKCSKIARNVFRMVECDYLIQDKSDIDYEKIAEIIKKQNGRGRASSIIIRENIIKMTTFIKNLSKLCPKIEIKGCVIGYLQRGTKPTSEELEFAKQFARRAIIAVTNDFKCTAICYKGGDFEVIGLFQEEKSKNRIIELFKKKTEE